MQPAHPAILAVLLVILAPAGGEIVDPPLRVSFHLADGMVIKGKLTAWSTTSFDGSFGKRRWVELRPADVYRLRRRLMNQDDPTDWIELGRTLLARESGERLAEKAFRRAISLDPKAIEQVQTVRNEVAEAEKQREQDDPDSQSTLQTAPPEGKNRPGDPWPSLTETQQQKALSELKSEAKKILARSNREIAPVETDYFLMYSDIDRTRTAKWAIELDKLYQRLAELFDINSATNIFHGRAVVLIFDDRQDFRKVELREFNQIVDRDIDGVCHCVGPKVFVNFYHPITDRDFLADLLHQTTHGFLHRYTSARRLPAWANEGLAVWAMATVLEESKRAAARRTVGYDFIRAGGNVNAVLDWTYDDNAWPGEDSLGHAVGYLLVDLMIRDRPDKFVEWVNAIKHGKDWETTLKEEFGVKRNELVRTAVGYYRVND